MEELVDALPGHVYWKDINSNMVLCNREQAKNLGLAPENNIAEAEDQDKLFEPPIYINDAAVMESGETKIFEEPLNNGIMISKKAPVIGNDGTLLGMAGVSIDITEQLQKIAAISKEKENVKITLTQIINNLDSHIYWKDTHGRFLGCNMAQARSAGFQSPEDMLGKTDFDMPWKDQAQNITDTDKQVIANKKAISIEEESTLADGRSQIFLSKKLPLVDKGKVTGILGVSIDISAEKEAQHLKQDKTLAEDRERTMKLMSSAIAHELKTPQTSIEISARYLSKAMPILLEHYEKSVKDNPNLPKLTDTQYMSITKENIGSKVLRLNNDCQVMVDMMDKNVRLAGLKGRRVHFYAKEIIQKALDDFPYKSKAEIALVKETKGSDIELFGDPDLFRHIILNLLKNAVYHVMQHRKGDIQIELLSHQNHQTIIFLDTGPGIAAEDLPKIFCSFYTKDTDHGTGVGLALCREVVEKNLGGTITCESEQGKFTKFRIDLPIVTL